MKNSLVARVIALTLVGTLVAMISVGYAFLRIFDESLDHQLENHLASYTDLLMGAIQLKGGEVVVEEGNPMLKSIPRHWQVDVSSRHIAKSPLLTDWLPFPKTPLEGPDGQKIELESGSTLLTVRQEFDFENGKRVLITFGLEEEVAEAFKNQLKEKYSRSARPVLLGLAVVLVLIGLAQVLLINYPLRHVKDALQRIRSGKANRIDETFPSEIQALSDELNLLMENMSGMLDRYRVFSNNMAHALKTPLTVIRNETDSELILEKVDAMLQVIDRNLAKVQTVGNVKTFLTETRVLPVVERISKGFRKLYQKDIETECSPDEVVRCEEADLYEILGNLLENACKFGKTRVRVQILNNVIRVEDDGSGLSESETGEILSRGVRLDKSQPGAGIGLAIVKEIVRLYGGTLELSRSEWGGLKVQIAWKQPPS